MKAVDTQLLTLLKKTPQFVVPIYQRLYSWTESECFQLWNDVKRAGEHQNLGAHFTGSIVYVARNAGTVTSSEPNLIIDGQQRVTTVCLMLAALARKLEALPDGEQEVIDGFSPKKIRERFLLDSNEEGDRRFKLELSSTDRAAMQAVLLGSDLSLLKNSRVLSNFEFFTGLFSDPKLDLSVICRGLDKLVVVDVQLEKGVDNPQLVFEAMNSTGKKLSQADLIRNFMLMDLERTRQSDIYSQFWHPMEKLFLEDEGEQFDSFARHYLTIRTDEIPRIGDVYDDFKSFFYKQQGKDRSSEQIAEDLYNSAVNYSKIALSQETDEQLRVLFFELEQIKADVVIPFVLRVYEDFDSEKISKNEFIEIVKLVISYVLRRIICEIPTNSMNKTFANFHSKIDVDNYLESVKANFALLQSYRRFPTDDEFQRELQRIDLYHLRRRSYVLRSLENFERKEPVSIEEYTIEHIMPQNTNLSDEWIQDLGPNWAGIQELYLHTMGNLTLTAYNSVYSDHSFAKKRDMENVGFKSSPLQLNKGLGQLDKWDESTIISRGIQLSETALKIWQYPKVSQDVLSRYSKVSKREPNLYSLADHPNLGHTPERKALFEKLDQALMAFDSVVSRHVLKLYVAYKAETNFCDVVPLAGKLLLSINVPFGELVDPRKIARDVSKISRWGNGDYEVSLSEDSDFDYILGLVRQAFEIQLESDL